MEPFSSHYSLPKVNLSGPHDYGFTPSVKGALNYARDSSLKGAIPYYKQLLKSEKKGSSHNIAIYLIRLASPILLLLGLILGFLAFYIGITSSAAFGLQSIIVDSTDSPVTDESKYKFSAKTQPTMQQWSLRAGEWGSSHIITLELPDAASMQKDAIVFVRNTSTEKYNSLTNPVSIISGTRNIQVKLGSTTETLGRRENNVYIAAKDSLGVQRWYPAHLMSGAI